MLDRPTRGLNTEIGDCIIKGALLLSGFDRRSFWMPISSECFNGEMDEMDSPPRVSCKPNRHLNRRHQNRTPSISISEVLSTHSA